jgi:hypothetical protein
MPFCSSCGTEYKNGSTFCASCGNKLDGALINNANNTNRGEPSNQIETLLWEGKPAGLRARLKDAANLNSVEYKITNQRVVIKTGLIGKKQEQIDLFRIKDIRTIQGLKDRALGIGDISIISTDALTPSIKLEEIKNPGDVSEILRRAVRSERCAQGVHIQERM